MKTSSYLEQTLSYEQSPATDQYFEVRASDLFELQEAHSCIEIHVQRPCQDQSPDRWTLLQRSDLKSGSKSDPRQEYECDSEPPSPVDWHRFSRDHPPHYVGQPGLEQQKISDPSHLKGVASVRKSLVATPVQADIIHDKKESKKFFRIWYVH